MLCGLFGKSVESTQEDSNLPTGDNSFPFGGGYFIGCFCQSKKEYLEGQLHNNVKFA